MPTPAHILGGPNRLAPGDKLNVACIGVGGRGEASVNACRDHNIVGLCDVDDRQAAGSYGRFPAAKKYRDFRKMIAELDKGIDAVTVGTPDHMHTYCAVTCMQAGKHVYVEKPLTRLAGEARLMAQAAEKYRVATQMGNPGYSHDATRVACEIIWSGEIGDVKDVHAWTGRPSWPQGMTKVPAPTPVPETLEWDLWLGGAAWRPFNWKGVDGPAEIDLERNLLSL